MNELTIKIVLCHVQSREKRISRKNRIILIMKSEEDYGSLLKRLKKVSSTPFLSNLKISALKDCGELVAADQFSFRQLGNFSGV